MLTPATIICHFARELLLLRGIMDRRLTLSFMLTLGVILILSLGALRLSGYRLTAQAVTADRSIS